MRYAELVEAVIRVANPNHNPPYLVVLKNPRPGELLALIDRVEEQVRGFVADDACYFWDGEAAIHSQVEAMFGYDTTGRVRFNPYIVITKNYEDGEIGGRVEEVNLFVDPARYTDRALANQHLQAAIKGLSLTIVE